MKRLKLARTGYLAISIIFYLAGIAYIILPQDAPLAVCISGGVILLAYGVIKIVGYFSKDLYCLAFQYDLACGLLLILLGVIVLARNRQILPLLSPGLGLLILLDSVLAVQMSKDAQRFGLEAWHVILITAAVAGVFGVLLLVRPFQGRFAAHITAGGALIAAGLKNQCVVTLAVKAAKTRLPEAAEDEASTVP